MTLAEKIAQASEIVGGALKADKTNTEQRYDYVSADKILTVCGAALAKAGVVIIPGINAESVEMFEYTDQYGKAKRRYDALVTFLMTVTDGETTYEIVWPGRGSDYVVPDKALYKAITSGHKYFIAKLLNVGAGNEDGEHEGDEKPQPRKVTVQQKPPANGKPQEQPRRTLMTLDMAATVTNKEGMPYTDIDSETLSNMTIGINKALKKPSLTAEQIAEYQFKLDAIAVILESRNS